MARKKGQEGATTREGEVAARAGSAETHEYHNVSQQQNSSGCYSINKRKEHLQGQKYFHQQMDFKWGEKNEQKLLGIDGGEKEYLEERRKRGQRSDPGEDGEVVPRLKVHDRGGL